MIANGPEEAQTKKSRSHQTLIKKNSKSYFAKNESMDKIDRIVNFDGKIVDENLILDGCYRVNKSGT
jgi:hypothetical protein